MYCRALKKSDNTPCTRRRKKNGYCGIHKNISVTNTKWFQSLGEVWVDEQSSDKDCIIFMNKFYILSPYFETYNIIGATKIIYKILLKILSRKSLSMEQRTLLTFYRKIFFYDSNIYFNTNIKCFCSHCLSENAHPTRCCGLHQCDDCFLKTTKCECGFIH